MSKPNVRAIRVLAALSLAAVPVGGAAWRSEGPDLAVVVDLAVSPAEPDTLYAATSAGGVWRSDDGGSTWTLPGAEMTSRSVTWVEIDPTNPATLYAGEDGGGAFWRSTDRGATWDRVQSNLSVFHPVGQRIAFSPTKPPTIFVPATNLHYRSNDGGKTWSDFRVPNQDAYCFAVDPKNPKTVYAGGRGSMLQFSRSEDGGKTWKQTGVGLPATILLGLVVDPAQPATIYARTRNELFKSVDRGDSWTSLDLGVDGRPDVFSLGMHPTDPRVLWATTEKGVLRSDDGGASWVEAERGLGRFLGKDIAYSPRNSQVLFAGTAGTGVYRSADGGSSWSPSSRGLGAGWTERVYASPAGPGALFAKMSVGLFRRDAAGAWTEVREPFSDSDPAELDGIVFDRFSPSTIWAFEGANLFRSADGGRNWQQIERQETSMRDMLKGKIDSVGYRSFVQDPANPKVLYAGLWSSHDPGSAIWKTSDGGKKWLATGTGVPNKGIVLLLSEAAGTVFAVTDEKTIFRTTDAGRTWTQVGGGLPDGDRHQVLVDPGTPTRLFAATEKGLYRSTDNGATFARVANGLEDDDIEAVVVAPGGTIYAGSFHGVSKSTDGGTTWSSVSQGLPNTDVRALAIGGPAPLRLYAGIAGGSVYSSELP